MIAPATRSQNGGGLAPYELPYRAATAADAVALAELVNFAGDGLPLYLWTRMAVPGQSPWEVGRQRARRRRGGFSFRNAVVREDDGRAVAALLGYPLADRPDPTVYDELPPMFVPLQELEDFAAGTWYINVLASYPDYRGRGFGSALLGIADKLARSSGRNGLSLIVSDANAGARRLYERHGFREKAARRMVRESWENPGRNWILMNRAGDA